MCSSDGKIISLIQSKFKNDSESLTTGNILCDIVESENSTKPNFMWKCDVFSKFSNTIYIVNEEIENK